MTNYGEVIAILNDEYVLIKMSKEYEGRISNGDRLDVFDVVENPELKSIGLEKLFTYKGAIKITMRQSGDIFLAARFVEGERIVQRPTTLGSLTGMFSQEVKVGGEWSAEIDQSKSLGLAFDSGVKVGDLVGQR
jgi:hypothetical protein